MAGTIVSSPTTSTTTKTSATSSGTASGGFWSGIASALGIGGSSGTTTKTSAGSSTDLKSQTPTYSGYTGGSSSGSTAGSTAPPPRPSVMAMTDSSGKTTYVTSTGQRYAEPSYSGFSLKGLTSTDPANVARNQYYAAQYANMPQSSGSDKPQPTLVNRATAAPAEPKMTSQQLASIGAPTTPMAPIEVPSPSYGPPVTPGNDGGYASAYAGIPSSFSAPIAPGSGLSGVGGIPMPVFSPYQPPSQIDIFSYLPFLQGYRSA